MTSAAAHGRLTAAKAVESSAHLLLGGQPLEEVDAVADLELALHLRIDDPNAEGPVVADVVRTIHGSRRGRCPRIPCLRTAPGA